MIIRYLVKIKNVNPVKHLENEKNLLITNFNEEEKYKLEEILEKNSIHVEIISEKLQLAYDNFSYNAAIKKLLPQEFEEIPGSYEIIGRIAHLNLREKFSKYKNTIGQIIIDV